MTATFPCSFLFSVIGCSSPHSHLLLVARLVDGRRHSRLCGSEECIYGIIRSFRSFVSCRLKLSCVSIQSAKPALRILIVLRIVSSPKLSIQSTKDQFAICSYGVACSP